MTEKVEKLIADANCGYVGISPSGDVCGGYDNGYPEASLDAEYASAACEPEDIWTTAERRELADIMMARWVAYKLASADVETK